MKICYNCLTKHFFVQKSFTYSSCSAPVHFYSVCSSLFFPNCLEIDRKRSVTSKMRYGLNPDDVIINHTAL